MTIMRVTKNFKIETDRMTIIVVKTVTTLKFTNAIVNDSFILFNNVNANKIFCTNINNN